MEVKRHFSVYQTVLVAGAVILISATLAGAQTYNFNIAGFATGNQPKAVATADLNGDGNPDMVIANYKDNTVSVIIGAPAAVFQKQVTYAVGTNPTGIAVGDFNGDSKLDLAVVNQNCPTLPCAAVGNISLLFGNGNGTFQKAVTAASVANAPNAIVAGDFNKDGILDMAVANTQSDNITVLLGTGKGAFSAGTNYATGTAAASLAVSDFNGDGVPDLAVVNKNSSDVSVLLGNGDGTFAAQPAPPTGTFPVGIVVGDFNGDGKMDIATANSFLASIGISVLLGNGNGTFQTHKDYATLQPSSAITAGDYNNDGKLDLAVTATASGSVGLLLGKGNGNFRTHVDYLVGGTPAAVASADFNSDGAQDLAVASTTDNNVVVLPGTGTGAFQLNGSVSVGAQTEPNPSSIAVGDFQGAGKPADIAIASAGTGTITILLANGHGNYKAQPAITVGTSLVSLVAKDVNDDNKVDLIAADNKGSKVWVLLGNGNGSFQTPVSYTLSSAPTCVLVDDLDGDGSQDIVACDKGVSILFGKGDGTFNAATDFKTGGNTFPVAATDGRFLEGELDLAVVASGTNSIVVLLNKGHRQFSQPVSIPVNTGPTSVAAFDFNGDGFLDLAVSSTGTNHVGTLSFLSGNGNGNFSAPVQYTTASGPLSVMAGDFNGDGKGDVVVGYSNPNGNGIAMMTGNGNGTFNPPVGHVTSWGANGSQGKYEGIDVADINGDGSPDVVAADEMTELVSWYLNSSLPSPYPSSLNFGNQKTGTSSNPLTVTLGNSGSANLNVSAVNATSPFSQTNTCTNTVPPGEICEISVTFTPTTKGQATGTLTITDTGSTVTQKVALSGTGD